MRNGDYHICDKCRDQARHAPATPSPIGDGCGCGFAEIPAKRFDGETFAGISAKVFDGRGDGDAITWLSTGDDGTGAALFGGTFVPPNVEWLTCRDNSRGIWPRFRPYPDKRFLPRWIARRDNCPTEYRLRLVHGRLPKRRRLVKRRRARQGAHSDPSPNLTFQAIPFRPGHVLAVHILQRAVRRKGPAGEKISDTYHSFFVS